MKDMIGNRLMEGGWAYWKSKELIVQVIKIMDESHPPVMIIGVQIPIEKVPRGQEAVVGDFLCVVNPDHERVIEGMLEGQQTQ